MLPLVHRELTRAGRRQGLYAARVLVPAASFLVLAVLSNLVSLTADPATPGAGFDSEWFGRALTTAVFLFQLATVAIMAPILSAGVITQEKQERTLSLLLLADMRGYDIILSKWISVVVQTILFLWTTLPVLAIAAFFGGVMVPAMALQVLLMSVGAATLAAAGVFMSTVSTRTGEAVVATVIFMALYSFLINVFGGMIWPGHQLDVFTAAYQAEPLVLQGPFACGPPLLVAAFISSALLLASASILPSRAFEKPAGRREAKGVVKALTRPIRARRRKRKRKQEDPVVAIVRRCSTGFASSLHPNNVRIVSVLLALAALFICPLAAPLIVALIAYDVASSARHLRTTGVLDDLTLTALDGRERADGIYKGHRRRCGFYFLALCATSAYGLGMFGMFLGPLYPADAFDQISTTEFTAGIIAVVLMVVLYAEALLRMVTAAACAFAQSSLSVPVQVSMVIGFYIVFRTLLSIATTVFAAVVEPALRMLTVSDWVVLSYMFGLFLLNIGATLTVLRLLRMVHRRDFR